MKLEWGGLLIAARSQRESQIDVLYQIKRYTHSGGEIIKPEYEKPVAMPLGEAAKGTGQCNAGSGVMPSSGGCSTGAAPNIYNCTTGNSPEQACSTGTQPNYRIPP